MNEEIKGRFHGVSYLNFCIMKRSNTLLLVSGEGGHMVQLNRLIKIIDVQQIKKSSNLVLITDAPLLDEELILIFDKIVVCPSLRDKSSLIKGILTLPYNVLVNLYLVFSVFVKCNVKVLISTGPGVAVIPIYLAFLTRRKTVFIETWSKYTSITITGKICRRVVDLFLVQNRSLHKLVKESIYVGRL